MVRNFHSVNGLPYLPMRVWRWKTGPLPLSLVARLTAGRISASASSPAVAATMSMLRLQTAYSREVSLRIGSEISQACPSWSSRRRPVSSS